jgi:hypothetical protein
MKPHVTMRKALRDKKLLGNVIAGDSWSTWRTLLIAAMGEKLTDDERLVFTKITGREHEPLRRVHELEVIAGRRGGKTRAMSTLISYLAGLCDHRDVLIRGETGVMLCLAQTQPVATKILDFVQEDFESSPILRQLIVTRTSDTLELKDNINIEVRPASFRKLRGPTYIGIIADELGFWFTDDNYQNPDVEILAAASPGLLTTHGPIIMASSPYARKGVLWENYRKHYGLEGSPLILVAKGTTRDFNATVLQEEIDLLLEKDPARNTAEYLAEFRTDIEAFVRREIVDAAVVLGRHELPRLDGVQYYGFCDPSGGSSDSFTLAIGHVESDCRVIIDVIRERRPPFSPDDVTREFCDLLKGYGVYTVYGDNYAVLWPRERFVAHGVQYAQANKVKRELYASLLPLLNSGRIELLDHPRCIAQLCSLERHVTRGGRDDINHPPGMHDDVINAVAGVAVTALFFAVQEVPIVMPFFHGKNCGEMGAGIDFMPAAPAPAPPATAPPVATSQAADILEPVDGCPVLIKPPPKPLPPPQPVETAEQKMARVNATPANPPGFQRNPWTSPFAGDRGGINSDNFSMRDRWSVNW